MAGGFAPRPPKPPVAGGSDPKSPSVIPMSYTSFLNTFPKLRTLFALFNYISLSPLSLQNPGYMQTGNNDFRSFILQCLCPTKISSLEKF